MMGGSGWKEPTVYAVKHRREDVRKNSRSGGMFTALSDQVFDMGGVVYGCVTTPDFLAVHIRAVDGQTRDQMRGSKYIQSSLGDTFAQVKQDLEENRIVLFSGTGCQVAGLKAFLGKTYENLICVDIVCHGVPSKRVWKEYMNWQERRAGSTVKKVDFRNKKDFGWTAHIETLWMENGKPVSSEVFKNLFYGHAILRPSCYECPYKSIHRNGDISLADYWRVERVAPEFADDRGTSLVLVNSDKGKKLFDRVKQDIVWKQTDLAQSMQQPLRAPFPKPIWRELFWGDFFTKPFSYVAKKYADYGTMNRVKHLLRRIRKKFTGS